MARQKKSMIGFDPLAWLDDKPGKADAADETEAKKVSAATTKKGSEKMKSSTTNVLGHVIDEVALLKGYALAADVLDDVVVEFYNELFKQYPAVKPLFEKTTEKAQAGKLAAVLKLLVDNLHNEDALLSALTAMGERHQDYGALPDHFPVVAELLVASFKKSVGRSWTKAVSAAWMELLVAAAETMCAAYKDVKESEEVEVKSDQVPAESENLVLHLNCIQDISKSLALKNDILTLVNDNDEIDIDASEVERIDGSALQLLCALFAYAQQNNLVINWLKPSDALLGSAKILGVQQLLELT